MASLIHNILTPILILALTKNQLGICSSPLRNDAAIQITTTRECKPVKECTFSKNLMALQKIGIPGLQKTAVSNELMKQNCGWEDDIEPKGNY